MAYLLSSSNGLGLWFMALLALVKVYHGSAGSEFIFGFLENRIIVDYPIPRVYVTSLSTLPVRLNITVPADPWPVEGLEAYDVTILPGEVFMHEFPYDVHLLRNGKEDKGIHIVADGAISVQAASINDKSTDACTLLPVTSLGTRYYVISYVFTGESVFNQGPTSLAIIGTVDNTYVHIVVADRNVTVDYAGYDIDHDGRHIFLYLNRFQTYQLQSWDDLTGTSITTSHPVAVMSGAVWSSVDYLYMGDHLVEQLPPVASWGNTYITSPLQTRTQGDLFRILASEDNTWVNITSPFTGTFSLRLLHASEYTEVDMASTLLIHATRPILVAQLCKSFIADNNRQSDPFLIVLPAVEQYSPLATFAPVTQLRASTEKFTLFATLWTTSPETLLLDCEPLAGHEDWVHIPRTSYHMLTLALPLAPHMLIDAKDVPFGAIAYGFRLQESYGYPIRSFYDSEADTVTCQVETTVRTTMETTMETTIETTMETTMDTTMEPTVKTTMETTVQSTTATEMETTIATTIETTVDTPVETTVETTEPATTMQPTTPPDSTTLVVTTDPMTTLPPSTHEPSTFHETSTLVTTERVTTEAPTTPEETTLSTTLEPTTFEETTLDPTTTLDSTTMPPTEHPTTLETTVIQTTEQPTTLLPTTEAVSSTVQPTTSPTTEDMTTTTEATTAIVTSTVNPTTDALTTEMETTTASETAQAITTEATTMLTEVPSTVYPTTHQETTFESTVPTTESPSTEVSTLPATTDQPLTISALTTSFPSTHDFTTAVDTTTRHDSTTVDTTVGATTFEPTILATLGSGRPATTEASTEPDSTTASSQSTEMDATLNGADATTETTTLTQRPELETGKETVMEVIDKSPPLQIILPAVLVMCIPLGAVVICIFCNGCCGALRRTPCKCLACLCARDIFCLPHQVHPQPSTSAAESKPKGVKLVYTDPSVMSKQPNPRESLIYSSNEYYAGLLSSVEAFPVPVHKSLGKQGQCPESSYPNSRETSAKTTGRTDTTWLSSHKEVTFKDPSSEEFPESSEAEIPSTSSSRACLTPIPQPRRSKHPSKVRRNPTLKKTKRTDSIWKVRNSNQSNNGYAPSYSIGTHPGPIPPSINSVLLLPRKHKVAPASENSEQGLSTEGPYQHQRAIPRSMINYNKHYETQCPNPNALNSSMGAPFAVKPSRRKLRHTLSETHIHMPLGRDSVQEDAAARSPTQPAPPKAPKPAPRKIKIGQ